MPKKSKAAKPVRAAKRAKRKVKDGSSSERSGYSQKIRAKKLEQANKSKGCPLQLLILSMPFVAVAAAAYWFLRA